MSPLDTDAIAEEFAENGLDDAAEYLREHGPAETRRWLDGRITEARENPYENDPEGWVVGNLEVARDQLAAETPPAETLTLTVETGNAAMQTSTEIAAAVREAADRIGMGEYDGRIRDENGNTVGGWEFRS